MIILEVLFDLALSLVERSIVVKEPEDTIYPAKYLRFLRDSVYVPTVFRRQLVTAWLVETFALQTRLKINDGVQTLEEMTALT